MNWIFLILEIALLLTALWYLFGIRQCRKERKLDKYETYDDEY